MSLENKKDQKRESLEVMELDPDKGKQIELMILSLSFLGVRSISLD